MGKQLLSVRAYARHRGCSHPAVLKAISGGRLVASVTWSQAGGRGVAQIDPEVADDEWDRNTDVRRLAPEARAPEQAPALEEAARRELEAETARARARAAAKARRDPQRRLTFGADAPEPGGPGRHGDDPERAGIALQLRKAQAVRATMQGTLDHLRAQQLARSLVPAKGVAMEAAALGHSLALALSSVGARVADLVAAETDPRLCEQLVTGEIHKALEAYWRHHLLADPSETAQPAP